MWNWEIKRKMHITPESRLHFQTTCFSLLRLYRYDTQPCCFYYCHLFLSFSDIFFLSSSAYPRKECMCKPFSQFIFLDARIIPFGVSVYLDQGETLPTQHKSWQPVELDLTSVFQSSLLTLGLGTHIFCLTPNNMLECSCCATGNLYLINQACSTDDVALEHRLWI